MAKPRKTTFKLSVKLSDGLSSQSSGECGDGVAFAMFMLPLSDADKHPQEGTAGEFHAARTAYLKAAAKYYAESKQPKEQG